jgi:hypothetical protein
MWSPHWENLVHSVVFVVFGILLVGTYSLTKKKSRTADDFPFHKVSNGAVKTVPHGWRRTAFQKVIMKNKPQYTVQATIWKDKKLVGFLHNHLVKQNSNEEVLRWDSVTRRRKQIPSHAITKDYALHMNGVDHKDRDTADWTVSVKTNRFYMRIFFWLIDGVLRAMYTILKAVVGDNTAHKWRKYLRKMTDAIISRWVWVPLSSVKVFLWTGKILVILPHRSHHTCVKVNLCLVDVKLASFASMDLQRELLISESRQLNCKGAMIQSTAQVRVRRYQNPLHLSGVEYV